MLVKTQESLKTILDYANANDYSVDLAAEQLYTAALEDTTINNVLINARHSTTLNAIQAWALFRRNDAGIDELYNEWLIS